VLPEIPWFQMTMPLARSGPVTGRSQKARSVQKNRLPGSCPQASSLGSAPDQDGRSTLANSTLARRTTKRVTGRVSDLSPSLRQSEGVCRLPGLCRSRPEQVKSPPAPSVQVTGGEAPRIHLLPGWRRRAALRRRARAAGVEATLLGSIAHRIVDLGDDEYTRGRPHPMIDPSQREAMLREAGEARDVGLLLLDLVLGRAAHADPACPLAVARPARSTGRRRLRTIAAAETPGPSRTEARQGRAVWIFRLTDSPRAQQPPSTALQGYRPSGPQKPGGASLDGQSRKCGTCSDRALSGLAGGSEIRSVESPQQKGAYFEDSFSGPGPARR
jgi:hypothetical protein